MGEFKAALQKLWKEGSAILPWLRRNGDTLRGMVCQGWTWAQLATVLNDIGITYKTKHPWTALSLRTKTFIAHKPLKTLKPTMPPNAFVNLAVSKTRSGAKGRQAYEMALEPTHELLGSVIAIYSFEIADEETKLSPDLGRVDELLTLQSALFATRRDLRIEDQAGIWEVCRRCEAIIQEWDARQNQAAAE